jgi:transcriptional regulator with XRE-family HTH domain
MSTSDPRARRRAFARELLDVMAVKSVTQRALAERVSLTQGAISGWCSGASEPVPAKVFEVETKLELPPGQLSRHLGYVPVDGEQHAGRQHYERVVLDDPALSNQNKRVLLTAYEAMVAPEANRPGRRPARTARP